MSTTADHRLGSMASAVIQTRDQAAISMARAVAAATDAARWEIADMVARRGSELAPDLLRGRACELALSPLADDQILSVILDQAAGELEQGRDLLAAGTPLDGPSTNEQSIFDCDEIDKANWIDPTPDDDAWARELVVRRRSLGLSPTGLASRLAEDAGLQAWLCTDLRIPADTGLRRRMAALVPLIIRRGREMNPTWWRQHFPGLAESGPIEPTHAMAVFARPAITLCTSDHQSLMRLACATLLCDPRAASPLLREIERAAVVPDQDLPPQVVRLGANVGYSDVLSGIFHRVRLVGRRPTRDAAVLSVLTPVGSALIGLKTGETIHWPDHFGLETIVTVRTVEHDARS